MEHVILIIHLVLTLALIGLILLQRSEGGGLGIGGGGMGNFASAQSTANALTKSTQWVAGAFFVTSLILAILASHRGQPASILDAAAPAALTQEAPASSPEPKSEPSVPISQ